MINYTQIAGIPAIAGKLASLYMESLDHCKHFSAVRTEKSIFTSNLAMYAKWKAVQFETLHIIIKCYNYLPEILEYDLKSASSILYTRRNSQMLPMKTTMRNYSNLLTYDYTYIGIFLPYNTVYDF